MDKTSYLFMSRRKRLKFAYRTMEKHSSTDSNISLDSLEINFKEKARIKAKSSDENVDTILVPFYENDVLIKVPKDQKKNVNTGTKSQKLKEKAKKETEQCYLVNKVKSKRATYLEMFRKQFAPNTAEKRPDTVEIRSLSPQFGDTESIEDDANIEVSEFFNTESYNDIYYEKLLNRDFQAYMDQSLEELQLTEDLNLESSANYGDHSEENLKSVSEVSNRRRPARRTTIEPVVHNLKLGGLGPDVEKIKPRLERARSLQRYSEKVRMENRLKIYKKTVQADHEKKNEIDKAAKRRNSGKERKEKKCDSNASYLMNKIGNEKNEQVKGIYKKTKSADSHKTNERSMEKKQCQKQRSASKGNETRKADTYQKPENKVETSRRSSGKASSRINSGSKNKAINTETSEVTPVQISFLVNIGGVRPSSALRTLEEKHRMYQEQVKAFMNDNNKG